MGYLQMLHKWHAIVTVTGRSSVLEKTLAGGDRSSAINDFDGCRFEAKLRQRHLEANSYLYLRHAASMRGKHAHAKAIGIFTYAA
jgi:hypothetical protein